MIYGVQSVAIFMVVISGCWSFPEDRLHNDASSTDASLDAQNTDFITRADSTGPDGGAVCGNGMIDPSEDCESPFGPCCDPTACRYKEPGAECRASVGECDLAEACSGTEATCPADGFVTMGLACTDSSLDDCAVARCDGDGGCDQNAAGQPDGTVCNAGTGTCQGGTCQEGGVDPKTGNVLTFSFDDGTATDLSGNGHHGTIIGAQPQSGKIGLALNFNGNSDYVQVPDHPQLFVSNHLTIEAWLFHTNNDEIHTIYSDYVDSQLPQSEANVQLQPNGLIRFISNSGCGNEREVVDSAAGTSVPMHVWTHLAVTWDGSSVRFYLDGILQDTQPFAFAPCQKPSTAWRVGRRTDGTRVYEGLIDELKVSSYPKTEAQIQQSLGYVFTGGASPF